MMLGPWVGGWCRPNAWNRSVWLRIQLYSQNLKKIRTLVSVFVAPTCYFWLPFLGRRFDFLPLGCGIFSVTAEIGWHHHLKFIRTSGDQFSCAFGAWETLSQTWPKASENRVNCKDWSTNNTTANLLSCDVSVWVCVCVLKVWNVVCCFLICFFEFSSVSFWRSNEGSRVRCIQNLFSPAIQGLVTSFQAPL